MTNGTHGVSILNSDCYSVYFLKERTLRQSRQRSKQLFACMCRCLLPNYVVLAEHHRVLFLQTRKVIISLSEYVSELWRLTLVCDWNQAELTDNLCDKFISDGPFPWTSVATATDPRSQEVIRGSVPVCTYLWSCWARIAYMCWIGNLYTSSVNAFSQSHKKSKSTTKVSSSTHWHPPKILHSQHLWWESCS